MWTFMDKYGQKRINNGIGGWQTGDYKISAQAATHSDPTGGTWYLCDGSATVGAALIAAVGATLPDARGRDLVMKGAHADVNAIGNSDGVTLASRRPKHKTSVTDPGHAHNVHGRGPSGSGAVNYGAYGTNDKYWIDEPTATMATGITAGPQTGAEPIDTPAYVVPGNLFVHS